MKVETNTKAKNIGREVRLIVRQPNGTISIYQGVLTDESDMNYTIKTDRGDLRTEPKLITAVEWLDG